MNFQQQERFFNMMTSLRANSRAASSQVPKEDTMVTEVLNGLIVTRPAKKITYLSETKQNTEEPEIIELTKSRAGSVPVNKLQEILRFQRSNGRL